MRAAVLVLIGTLTIGCEDVVPLQPLGAPPCTFDGSGGLCRTGRCEIVVPKGALDVPTFVELTTEPIVDDLGLPAVGTELCRVGPASIRFEIAAELRMHFAPEEIAEGFSLFDLVAFTVGEDGRIEKATATDAYPSFDRIALPVVEATLAGATIVPSDIRLEKELGKVALDVTDPASYLANLSSFPFRGVFFDGQRLYLGNGPRVLVWTNGVPADPLTPPDLILGKRDLTDDRTIVDAANIVGIVEDIWSDGERLVVSAGHRVLIWERIPGENAGPADLVLGQETFDTNRANGGGEPSAQSLFTPDELTSDGTRLLIADTSNHRVLLWNEFPRLFGQPADVVIGQPAFDRNTLRGGAIPLYQPRGVYLDANRLLVTSSLGCTCALGLDGVPADSNPLADFTIGAENGVRRVTPSAFAQAAAMSRLGTDGLALRDTGGNRVSLWRRFPAEPDRAPDVFIGKPSGDVGGHDISGVTAASLANDAGAHGGLFADEERVIVADETRVLFWNTIPETNFEPADLVIGQPTMTTAERGVDYAGIAADALAHPRGLSVDGERRAIADESNNRILVIDGERTIVIGQPDALSFLPNRGHEPRADTLSAPSDAQLVGNRLVVVDAGNHRVLVWRSIPTTDGAPADVVLGQRDFGDGEPNAGAPDVDKDGDRDANGQNMFFPRRAFVTGDRLYVSDAFNHRVLIFDGFASTSNAAADAVIGQPDFVANDPNRGLGWYERSATSLAVPGGLWADGDTLWVADRENNRILRFDRIDTTDDIADVVIGQPDFETDAAPNFQPSAGGNRGLPRTGAQLTTSAVTLRRPDDLVVTNDHVYIADTGNHRVLGYDRPLGAAPVAASVLFGQSDFVERVSDADGIGAASLESPSGLAVRGRQLLLTDAGNHRVLEFDLDSVRPGERPVAASVFGQIDAVGHGINKSAASPGRLSNPTGVAYDGTRLWVTDRDHHRVLAYVDDEPVFALGQPSLTRFLENGGGEPSASTLASPSDVYADDDRLIVADRHNHRVLMWSPPPTRDGEPADVVIGQPDFDSGEPNAGRGLDGPGADSLYAPEGIDFADGRLFVADTGNSRVLVFDGPFAPTGSSASHVMCQATMVDNRANQGRGAPDADTCASPRDVTTIEGEVFVADTLNNRVLVFADRLATSAERVLGQPDLTSRQRRDVSAKAMASPTSVTYDGTNVLVADTGHHRVLVYSLVPGTTGAAADRLIGQRSFEAGVPSPEESGLVSPTRIAVMLLDLNDTRVFVADAQKNRIAVFRGLSRIRTSR